MTGGAGLDPVRAIADAVLYEGYLLYPYRASSHKNRSRFQFGVLGPPEAEPASFAEDPRMSAQVLLDAHGQGAPALDARLRFLQLQVREVQRRDPDGGHTPVGALTVDGGSVLSWDEAVEHELALPAVDVTGQVDEVLEVPGGETTEPLTDAGGAPVGRIVRRRTPLTVRVRLRMEPADRAEGPLTRLTVEVANEHPARVADKDAAIRASLVGTHLLLRAGGAGFVSLVDPPPAAASAAAACRGHRCWPVLAGPKGSADTVLCAPIILYDHPEIAEQSPGALFDSTEIDEILTLRVMTMTEEEKAEARATDPRAREVIDRCDALSPAELQRLHGLVREPHAPADPGAGPRRSVPAMDPYVPGSGPSGPAVDLYGLGARPSGPAVDPYGPGAGAPLPGAGAGAGADADDVRNLPEAPFDTGGAPWWDPAADAAVRPAADAVVIDGVSVAKGSLVRVRPARRADAQDLFFAGRVARVTAVVSDVDGGVHVALVLVDDPAADLHDWYGRYFYFAPDELEPLPAGADTHEHTEESRS
ncbi:hypothetical protein [Streptomyces tremellae]|uniref:Uncharacterized protein n=1 Tax=Streptomyces tremellae TaxID=1124239 RepID=A0ABP7FQI8_9ACTN